MAVRSTDSAPSAGPGQPARGGATAEPARPAQGVPSAGPGEPAQPLRLPSGRALAWGIQLFIVVSVAAIILSSYWKTPPDFQQLRGQLNWRFALLLIPLVAADYWLGGLRYHVLFDGRILTHVSLWNCIRANWANIFLGAATPFQTGGGPAQIYLLWRAGASISEALLTSMVTFAGTLVFFVAASFAALILIPPELFGSVAMGLVNTAFIVVGLIAVLVLAGMIFPRPSLVVLRWIYDGLLVHIPVMRRSRERLLGGFAAGVDRFSGSVSTVWRRGKGPLLLMIFLTLVLFSNKFTIGYAVVRALGHDVPYGDFLGLSCVQLFLIYFAPTPGASGVAELSSVWLMARIIPAELLVVYTVLWRFLTTVLGAIIGGFVLLWTVRREGAPPRAG